MRVGRLQRATRTAEPPGNERADREPNRHQHRCKLDEWPYPRFLSPLEIKQDQPQAERYQRTRDAADGRTDHCNDNSYGRCCGVHEPQRSSAERTLALPSSRHGAHTKRTSPGPVVPNRAIGCRVVRWRYAWGRDRCPGQFVAADDDRRPFGIAETLTFCTSVDLERARQIVESVTLVKLAPHESLYRGGDYFLGQSEVDGELIVQRNEDLDERAVDVEAPTVVYVGPTGRSEELIGAFSIEGLHLIAQAS